MRCRQDIRVATRWGYRIGSDDLRPLISTSQDEEGIEYINIRDEGIDATYLTPAKSVNIGQMFIENLVRLPAGIVQVQCHVFKAMDDVLNLDRHSVAVKNLRPSQDCLHAVRFARHSDSFPTSSK